MIVLGKSGCYMDLLHNEDLNPGSDMSMNNSMLPQRTVGTINV